MLSQKIRISILQRNQQFEDYSRHMPLRPDSAPAPALLSRSAAAAFHRVALFRQRKNRVVERRATDLGDGDGGGLLLAKREGHGGGRVGGGRAGEEGKGSELHRGYY